MKPSFNQHMQDIITELGETAAGLISDLHLQALSITLDERLAPDARTEALKQVNSTAEAMDDPLARLYALDLLRPLLSPEEP